MKKKSNFVFKQRRSDLASVAAAYQAEKYSKYILSLTEEYNAIISKLFGYTVKCPDISAEIRAIWRMYSKLYN